MSGKEFVDLLKSRRKIGYLAVGANFRCGYGLDTGVDALEGLVSAGGIEFEAVPQVTTGGHSVSSSRIRRAISEGDVAQASGLLGRPFAIDLEGLPVEKTGDFFSWDLRAASRIVPRPGEYSVVLRQNGSDKGVQTGISLDRGRVLVDSKFFDSQAPGGIVEFV
jgi:riboflavin kinase/FMN adenylyltransferase